MAKKKEPEVSQAERPMPVHPDPNKETILLRYPNNGDVKVLSEIKKDDKGKVHMITTEPTLKNQAAFYEKRHSRILADMIANFRAQSQNPSDVPEIYKVPFNLVAQVASLLLKLQSDAKNEETLAMARKYRTSPQQLEKVVYDEARMPKAELQAMGFDIEQMAREGTFKEMELGKDSSKLYPLSIRTGENTRLEGVYSIHPTQNDQGEIQFEARGPLAIPEFLIDEKLKMELNAQEKEDLRAGMTLDRVLMHNDEYCYAAFNRRTNRMIYIPVKDVRVPNFLYNARLNQTQQEELRRGGRVLLENCHYFGNEISFRGIAQFDVHRMEFNIAKPYYSQVYIPEFIDKQLTKEMRETLVDRREEIDGRKLIGRDGRPYTNNLQINPETLGLEFVQYKRLEQTQAAVQQQAAAQTPADPLPEPVMHIPNEVVQQKSGQGVSM